jgi:hypothetical protein
MRVDETALDWRLLPVGDRAESVPGGSMIESDDGPRVAPDLGANQVTDARQWSAWCLLPGFDV